MYDQLVKNLSAMQETRVQFQGWEDPLEKEMATHSSILVWRLPYGAWQATVHGVAKSWIRLRATEQQQEDETKQENR